MKAVLYTTTEENNRVKSSLPFSKDTGEENQVLNLYEDICDQTLEGFGGALTDAAGYVFSQLSDIQKDTFLDQYFSEKQMNYNQVRIHMDSCDFSTHMYEADSNKEDENLEQFSFADTERYIIPLLDAAEKKAGKKLKIMLSAWSPPVYMKTNKSRLNGGGLKPEYRKRWAEYLCRYIEEFRNRGYLVNRMSVQNEPKAAQLWDSCQYTALEEKEFLRDYLVPAMKAHGLSDVEVFIWDHNKERIYERTRDIVDESTDSMIAGVAFHWYSGDHFEALDLVRKYFSNKKLILSESCLEFGKYEREAQLINAERLAHDMIGNLNHGMVGFYDWNVLLDGEGGPNHQNNYCDAPFLFDLEKQELIERKCLDYNWHFTHFIKPGAVRIAHTRYTDKLDMTAWKNPDSQIVFILLNRTDESLDAHLRFREKELNFEVTAHSIVSGVIEGKEEEND